MSIPTTNGGCGHPREAAAGNFHLSLSSEVCAEVREYDRFSTTACNAYVQPLMAGYLDRLSRQLKETGLACPLYLMLSGGGLATLETAMRFPIRLVESGPAGGAILAAGIAAESICRACCRSTWAAPPPRSA